MKNLIVIMFLAFVLAAGSTVAAAEGKAKKTPSPAQQAQYERMKSCNKEAKAKALKGNERKIFMKGCLSGKAGSAPASTPANTTPAK